MTDPMRSRAFDTSNRGGQASDGPVDVWVDDMDGDWEDLLLAGDWNEPSLVERLGSLPVTVLPMPVAGNTVESGTGMRGRRRTAEALVPERAAADQ